MHIPGWGKHGEDVYFITWINAQNESHVIVVAKTTDRLDGEDRHVWGYKWNRGVTLVVAEASGFQTLDDCMAALWFEVFGITDDYQRLRVEEARRIVGAKPTLRGIKPETEEP